MLISRVSSYIKSFVSNMRLFGLLFAVKYGLDFMGLATYITVRYPSTGTRVRVRTNNFWKKLEGGAWETDVMRCLANAAHPGQTVIDAGAWIGPHTLLLAEMVAPEGRVVAFEPDPEALHLLRDNIGATGCGNVCIENLCLGSKTGTASLKTNGTREFGHSNSTIMEQPGVRAAREISVPVTTIDQYCARQGITPDGIKIDVEGAEGLVIEGARRTISRCAPWVLLEFHGHLMDEPARTECWRSITAGARQITLVGEESGQSQEKGDANAPPGRRRRHVFIRY